MANLSKYNRATYEKILAAFREHPGNYMGAAKVAGVDRRMAKRAYLTGWPPRNWARPIHEVLAEEQAKAKVAIAERLKREREVADAEAEKSRSAAIEVAQIETQILQGARRNVAAVFGLSAKLVPAMDGLVSYVRELIIDKATNQVKPAADLEKAGINPDRALRLISAHSLILQRAFNVGFDVIQLRRLNEGLPGAIVGLTPVEMTAEQAADELENQEEALRLIKQEAEQRKGQVH